jgi:hypothetical protein
MADEYPGRERGPGHVPLTVQIIAGVGGLLLVAGAAWLGITYLDEGTWGSLHGPAARTITLGVAMLLGAALVHAVHRGDGH